MDMHVEYMAYHTTTRNDKEKKLKEKKKNRRIVSVRQRMFNVYTIEYGL